MTNGGLETIRSKRSPATGSNRLPARVSIASTPLSSAFSRVKARARSEMSVATIRSTVWRARRAWMPHPVPMSSPRPAGVSSWSPARVSEAPPAPSTCDSGSGPPSAASSRSLAIHHPCRRSRHPRRRRTAAGARARADGWRRLPPWRTVRRGRARPARRRRCAAAPTRRDPPAAASRAPAVGRAPRAGPRDRPARDQRAAAVRVRSRRPRRRPTPTAAPRHGIRRRADPRRRRRTGRDRGRREAVSAPGHSTVPTRCRGQDR